MDDVIADLETLDVFERYAFDLSSVVRSVCVELAENVRFGIEVERAEGEAGMEIDRQPVDFRAGFLCSGSALFIKKLGQFFDFAA